MVFYYTWIAFRLGCYQYIRIGITTENKKKYRRAINYSFFRYGSIEVDCTVLNIPSLCMLQRNLYQSLFFFAVQRTGRQAEVSSKLLFRLLLESKKWTKKNLKQGIMFQFVTGKWGTLVISHGPVVLCFSIFKETF